MAKRKKLSSRQQQLLDEAKIERKPPSQNTVPPSQNATADEAKLFRVEIETNFGVCSCYHKKRVQDDTQDQDLIDRVTQYLLGKKSTVKVIIKEVKYITDKIGLQ